jgi:hypothetical protein
LVLRADRGLRDCGNHAVIVVDNDTLREILRLLREVKHPNAPKLAKKILRAAVEQQKRDADFNEAPALCRPMAD